MIQTLPTAWLGYASPLTQPLTVRVCAWCPDKRQADALARTEGLRVTHTLCPQCCQKSFAKLLGENPDA